MFLDCLRRRNPELIEAAIRFHQFVTRVYTVGIAGLHGGEPSTTHVVASPTGRRSRTHIRVGMDVQRALQGYGHAGR